MHKENKFEINSIIRKIQGMGFDVKDALIPSKRYGIKSGYIKFLHKDKLREIDYDVAIYADEKVMVKCSVEVNG